ncbi:hypothetical protein [Lysobacter sp. CA199]|uniref:hypothetical protein n=1 Tax=Lysobacter sp. CA199 TaxID=3455608 RepID=UPI003F8D25A9
MPFHMYRSDNRPPQTIATDGFQARMPLDEDTARQLVRRSLIDPHAPLQLPDARDSAIVGYFQRTQANPTLVGLPALYAEFRRETSASTMHVSTSPDIGVGGILNRSNMYRIEVPNGRLYAWQTTAATRLATTPLEITRLDQAHPAADPKTGVPSTKPVLLTDTDSIDTARLFAISSPAGDGEVAFLTSVPKEWITQTRSLENKGPWQPMPNAHAQAPANRGTAPVAPPQPPPAAGPHRRHPRRPTSHRRCTARRPHSRSRKLRRSRPPRRRTRVMRIPTHIRVTTTMRCTGRRSVIWKACRRPHTRSCQNARAAPPA